MSPDCLTKDAVDHQLAKFSPLPTRHAMRHALRKGQRAKPRYCRSKILEQEDGSVSESSESSSVDISVESSDTDLEELLAEAEEF